MCRGITSFDALGEPGIGKSTLDVLSDRLILIPESDSLMSGRESEAQIKIAGTIGSEAKTPDCYVLSRRLTQHIFKDRSAKA